MMYMLDTNTVSSIMRNAHGRASTLYTKQDLGSVNVSILVSAELRFGYAKVGSERIKAIVDNFLTTVGVLDWAPPCDEIFAEIRAHLQRRGQQIGTMDMLIAAHALALDATLVTDNEREFGRVPGLKIENWVR